MTLDKRDPQRISQTNLKMSTFAGLQREHHGLNPPLKLILSPPRCRTWGLDLSTYHRLRERAPSSLSLSVPKCERLASTDSLSKSGCKQTLPKCFYSRASSSLVPIVSIIDVVNFQSHHRHQEIGTNFKSAM